MGAVFIVQMLGMGYFAGDQRGLNLPVGAVSMNAYGYKGLVSNELRAGRTWGCPQQSYLPPTYTQVGGNCMQSHRHMVLLYEAHFDVCHADREVQCCHLVC